MAFTLFLRCVRENKGRKRSRMRNKRLMGTWTYLSTTVGLSGAYFES